MKKAIKYVIVFFFYNFLVLEDFIGGGTIQNKDVWEDLIKWAKK